MPNTQSMGVTGEPTLSFTRKATNPADAAPMPVVTRTSFTVQEQTELKAIIKETLQEFFSS